MPDGNTPPAPKPPASPASKAAGIGLGALALKWGDDVYQWMSDGNPVKGVLAGGDLATRAGSWMKLSEALADNPVVSLLDKGVGPVQLAYDAVDLATSTPENVAYRLKKDGAMTALTYGGRYAMKTYGKQAVTYVTERAIPSLAGAGDALLEIAPPVAAVGGSYLFARRDARIDGIGNAAQAKIAEIVPNVDGHAHLMEEMRNLPQNMAEMKQSDPALAPKLDAINSKLIRDAKGNIDPNDPANFKPLQDYIALERDHIQREMQTHYQLSQNLGFFKSESDETKYWDGAIKLRTLDVAASELRNIHTPHSYVAANKTPEQVHSSIEAARARGVEEHSYVYTLVDGNFVRANADSPSAPPADIQEAYNQNKGSVIVTQLADAQGAAPAQITTYMINDRSNKYPVVLESEVTAPPTTPSNPHARKNQNQPS